MSNIPNERISPQATDKHGDQYPTFLAMRAARRWLIWQSVPLEGKKPLKVPHYAKGQRRSGALDSPDDTAQLVSYADAVAARDQRGEGWHLGFALGPDGGGGNWQGIDLDDVQANGLADVANKLPGYVEMSPSAQGAHAIGYGQPFGALASNRSGIEAYAAGRFFTVTEHPIRDSGLGCLASYVAQVLVPRHGAARPRPRDNGVEVLQVDAKTVTELRSALSFLRADDRDQWVAVGHALRELGEMGRGLWLDWSRSSEKFDPARDPKRWNGFDSSRTSYQAVFKRAQEQGWVNPASNAAQASPERGTTSSSGRKLIGRSLGGVSARAIDWLWTGWIPKGYITIFAGESGAGKSTVLADVAARVTTGEAWPGEPAAASRRPARVLWLGSEDSIEEMTVPRLMACGANLDHVIEIQGVENDGKRNTFSMQDDLEAVSEWLDSARSDGLPFGMLVIDPVTSYLPGQRLRKVDLNDAGQLRTILEPWLVLAQKHHIAIVCVTHFAKDTNRAMLHRVIGSQAFAATCRSLCAVVEPPVTEEDDEPDPFERALLQVKANLPEHPGGSWRFVTEKVEVATDQDTGQPIAATRPNWGTLDSALTPKTAVGPARGPKSKQEPAFVSWVNGLFSGKEPGAWLPMDEVKWPAIREGVASESWWNKHSTEHLEKENIDGTWHCRPKFAPFFLHKVG